VEAFVDIAELLNTFLFDREHHRIRTAADTVAKNKTMALLLVCAAIVAARTSSNESP
jgi:hypothetical protein